MTSERTINNGPNVNTYLSSVESYFHDVSSSEMSYRTAFQNYLSSVFPASGHFHIQHDPKAQSGNKPDFIVLKDDVPLLYIEVKKVGEDLNKIEKSSQASRYFGYTNLIISDYCEFRFYRNGEPYDEHLRLATVDVKRGTFIPHPGQGERLARTMHDFVESQKEPIKSGAHLARIMGGKAQRIRDNVIAFLESTSQEKDELERMMRFIRENLITTFTTTDFADMYAQTIVYGLFAARYNDPTADTFNRQEARSLIPKTNPFLQSFFDHIAGTSFPRRLSVIVDELCTVFTHADVKALMEEYFKNKDVNADLPDPVIHFYEDFLREYDPQKKMEMGVFYTPLPVVRFIIRGIDDLLKREFGISKGIADNSRIERSTTVLDKGKEKRVDIDTHRVQLLDVATGTGTFLNETITHIHESQKGAQGRWGAYVEDDLLPRLHGFELMMASYTIAHLKIAMTLKHTGLNDLKHRLGVYLTNTLDEAHDIPLIHSLFGAVESIAEESRLASRVKREYPIMVVMGNPPYSGESMNPHYTANDAYKVEPGGKEKLKEKNSKWINDDYVKFIRFAETMIEKNGEGIVGMITSHGYIDNPTFRGMRWHLRDTFDAIYVLDLHGNSNKKETTQDGGKDENVFDIKTGVSIFFGIKKRLGDKKKRKPLATIFKADLFGLRSEKFEALTMGTVDTIVWNELPENADTWKVEGEGKSDYLQGFSVAELFPINTVGIVTSRDAFVIDQSKDVLAKRIEDFLMISPNEAVRKYALGENQKWKIVNAQKHTFDAHNIVPISYRPFDQKYIYYSDDFIERSRRSVMHDFLDGDNVGLVSNKHIEGSRDFADIFLTDKISDARRVSIKETNYISPLYLYKKGEKKPNLDPMIVLKIELTVGPTRPEDIFDYVYAMLHSPSYRATYAEFLKSDFPRVPYPKDKEKFWRLVPLGRKLRGMHLLTDPLVETPITTFPIASSDIVDKISYSDGRVYINASQYWDGVPKDVWEFYIGGYQPAQKYLKDRKGQKLTTAEFENYEKMVVSLKGTIDVMKEIDLCGTHLSN